VDEKRPLKFHLAEFSILRYKDNYSSKSRCSILLSFLKGLLKEENPTFAKGDSNNG